MEQVALIGLGVMGTGMATRLLNAGYPLTVYNRTKDRAFPLVQKGARLASSPREAADAASFVICMVAGDEASRAVWQGDSGALQGCRRKSLLVESSTLSPGWARELADAASLRGCDFLDAPVTGSKLQSDSGGLLFLAGGSAQAVERASPFLRAMGREVVHVGPSGSGMLLKLINNFLCAVQVASLAEGLALIEKTGLDQEKALSVLIQGAPGSPIVKTVAPRMTHQDYSVHFRLRLMNKDLNYIAAEAGKAGLSLSTALAAREIFQSAIDKGDGEKDLSAVVETLRRH